MRQKHVPLSRKSASEREKRAPLGKKCVKNTYPQLESGIEPPSRPLAARVKRCFWQNTRVFSCILRHVGSDPVAERGRGEVNFSPIQVLTLRLRVGGFYVPGRFWEIQFVVVYVSGRLWEAKSIAFYTLRAGPPTQLSLFRASFCESYCTVRLTSRLVFARLSAHCAYRRV